MILRLLGIETMIMESLVGWKEGGCHVCASSHGNVVGETNGYRGDHLEMMNQAFVEAIGKKIGELMEADVGGRWHICV
jgi:hypothetical protein